MSTLPNVLSRATLVVADGGLETTLVFDYGVELTDFAAFPLLDTPEGRAHLRRYYEPYLQIAARAGLPMLLDTPTWRANLDWGARLGYDPDDLTLANQRAVGFVRAVAAASHPQLAVAINGVIGPRGDGYRAETTMTTSEATRYHAHQAQAFAAAGVDTITAVTMTTVQEAGGVALAAREVGLPAVISFTVEIDGRLPSGQSLADAITGVDDATGGWPAFFMINCAHPTHFEAILNEEPWTRRLGGLRANASACSHSELDAAEILDSGNPATLASDYRRLRDRLPKLRLVGGCCGTDHRHVACISASCRGSSRRAGSGAVLQAAE